MCLPFNSIGLFSLDQCFLQILSASCVYLKHNLYLNTQLKYFNYNKKIYFIFSINPIKINSYLMHSLYLIEKFTPENLFKNICKRNLWFPSKDHTILNFLSILHICCLSVNCFFILKLCAIILLIIDM